MFLNTNSLSWKQQFLLKIVLYHSFLRDGQIFICVWVRRKKRGDILSFDISFAVSFTIYPYPTERTHHKHKTQRETMRKRADSDCVNITHPLLCVAEPILLLFLECMVWLTVLAFYWLTELTLCHRASLSLPPDGCVCSVPAKGVRGRKVTMENESCVASRSLDPHRPLSISWPQPCSLHHKQMFIVEVLQRAYWLCLWEVGS